MSNLELVSKSHDVTAAVFLKAIFLPEKMESDEVICLSCSHITSNKKASFRNMPMSKEVLNEVSTSNKPYYYCVSSVREQAESDPHLRRGRDNTRFAFVVGLDDIGTKAKKPSVSPSYKIETSPGNFQWGYLIEPYELDGKNGQQTLFYEACIQGLINAGLSDPGAVGCYRLLRIPGSINTKPEHSGFRARVTYWDPDARWVLDDLMENLGVDPAFKNAVRSGNKNKQDTDILLNWLDENNHVVNRGDDFHTILCPWAEEHTDGNDNAQYSPINRGGSEYENGRQFKCFHAHCVDRDINDFLEFTKNEGGPDVSAQSDIGLSTALETVDALVSNNDLGAWFEKEALHALKIIKITSNADYQRVRGRIRQQKSLSITELEKALKQFETDAAETIELTHNTISKAIINEITAIDAASPVGCYGELYRCKDGIWAPVGSDGVVSAVANSRFDGEGICRMGQHYKSIANLMFSQSDQPSFFSNAPAGFAAANNFYIIDRKGNVTIEELSSQHRCRYKLSVAPALEETPLFDKFINETFESQNPDETAQQIRVLQEIIGGVLFGFIASFQKAILLYGATRAGKGVLVKIIQAMLPKNVISAVSPYSWGKEYHVAAMAGMKLNLCGEFPEDNQLPAAPFKQITGGDPVSGRNPAGRVFTFVADASQVFSCNYLPFSREQSASFYGRWEVLHFPHTVSEKDREPNLADRIIESELSGILEWALAGASRLIEQGRFSESLVHNRTMGEWRLRSDTVAAFINLKGEKLSDRYETEIPTSHCYSEYVAYCEEEQVKAVGKKTFFARLESVEGVVVRHFKDGDKVVIKGAEV
jgi:P4 family phage/plasmid primase-like protien